MISYPVEKISVELSSPNQISTPPKGVDIWLLDLDEIDINSSEKFSSLLSEDELHRAQQFKRNPHHFLATRALLRITLSRYTDISPKELLFSRTPQGKPFLANLPAPLYFNLSHSTNFAALAISHVGEIGIDIETIRKNNYLKIVERFFHKDEIQQILNCEEAQRQQLFYRMWTFKEAFFKATGTGISSGLDKACFYLRDNKFSVNFSDDLHVQKNHWQFHQEFVASTTVVAVALASEKKIEHQWFDGNLLLSAQ